MKTSDYGYFYVFDLMRKLYFYDPKILLKFEQNESLPTLELGDPFRFEKNKGGVRMVPNAKHIMLHGTPVPQLRHT
jgi:hypothetical protein